jgi:S1-C subfamily serine protease
VPQLLKYGKVTRPALGINILSDQIAAQYKIDGVVILQVMPGGSADQAGIQGAKSVGGAVTPGDVIVGIDSTEIHRSNDLYKAMDTHKVGDVIDVTVENAGKRRTVKVTLQALP